MHKLFLVSGPSGSGKTTIMHALGMQEIISVTTRAMREGEVDGRDYYYTDNEAFALLQKHSQLVEESTYAGNHYGVEKREIESKLSRGPAFCIVDFNGMQALSAVYRHVVPVFIYADELNCYMNMKDRDTPVPIIMKRLDTYAAEMRNRFHYAYVIRNVRGKFDNAVEIIRQIVEAEC